MIPLFKFFNENIDKRPKTRDDVRVMVYENLSILYDGTHRESFEAEVENITDMVCNHLNINLP
jgi:hypothetical protein